MDTVHAQIEIAAPPQVVFDTVLDPSRLSEWVTIHRSVKWDSSQRLRPGAEMDQVLHMRGFSFKVHWTLESVSPPTSAEWHGRGPAMSKAVTRYELSGPDEGPTTFDYFNEFHPPGGRLGAVAQRAVVGATAEREAHDSLQKLKQLLESK
jgi:uncharacterized protein YndB with AHSA1/START domain